MTARQKQIVQWALLALVLAASVVGLIAVTRLIRLIVGYYPALEFVLVCAWVVGTFILFRVIGIPSAPAQPAIVSQQKEGV